MLDKAIALDPNNPIARFHRGHISVNGPPFLVKLDGGIQDLELLVIFSYPLNRLGKDFQISRYRRRNRRQYRRGTLHLCLEFKGLPGQTGESWGICRQSRGCLFVRMEYQSASANFTIGKKDARVVVEEGNLIPYLMMKYYSE